MGGLDTGVVKLTAHRLNDAFNDPVWRNGQRRPTAMAGQVRREDPMVGF